MEREDPVRLVGDEELVEELGIERRVEQDEGAARVQGREVNSEALVSILGE